MPSYDKRSRPGRRYPQTRPRRWPLRPRQNIARNATRVGPCSKTLFPPRCAVHDPFPPHLPSDGSGLAGPRGSPRLQRHAVLASRITAEQGLTASWQGRKHSPFRAIAGSELVAPATSISWKFRCFFDRERCGLAQESNFLCITRTHAPLCDKSVLYRRSCLATEVSISDSSVQ